jgi:hypothetical protein
MSFWSRRSPSTLFEQRFEVDDDAFLFQIGRQGLQVRVSAAERNEFVTQFRHGYRLGYWMMVGLLIAAITVSIAIYLPRGQDVPERLIQAVVWLIMIGFVVGYFWLWFAPNRALAGRTSSGPAQTRAERRDRAIGKLSWFQALSLFPIGALVVADAIADDRPMLQLAKAFIGLLLIGLCVWTAVLKLQCRRRSATPP